MIKRSQIRNYVQRVAERFHPQRVILFGSYAYGQPSKDSDVDLLVVMPHDGHPALMASEIRKNVRSGFPLDLIVRSPDEIRRRMSIGDGFIQEILNRGQPLYEG
jgi:predicted nucleotidyltransferase